MIRRVPEAGFEDPRSSASHDGFAKLFLMYQTAREAAEAVSDDSCSSTDQDAFEKALSISLKDLVLRIEWRDFTSFANFRVHLGVGVNFLPYVQCGSGRLSRPLPMRFRPMGLPGPPRPPPIIAINQFGPPPPGCHRVHLKTFVSSHRISPLIPSSDRRRQFTMEPSPTTDRSNSRCQYRSRMNRITISTPASFVGGVGPKSKCRNAPPHSCPGRKGAGIVNKVHSRGDERWVVSMLTRPK
jgi:hypothetical protein